MVDNNVTRHVPRELLNADWSAMIMHYLGLDHIGHKTGPRGYLSIVSRYFDISDKNEART